MGRGRARGNRVRLLRPAPEAVGACAASFSAARPQPAPRLAFRRQWADIGLREVGGGRATRQPGQVRKEAALTSAVRVARQPPTSVFLMAIEARARPRVRRMAG